MDYLKQLNAYRRKRLASPISSGAIALYTILMEYANDLYFPEQFTAANSVICGLSGLSLTRMQAARKELCDGGFLAYAKGGKNQCGTYRLVDLVQTRESGKKTSKPDTVPVTVPDTVPDILPDTISDTVPVTLPDMVPVTLNKPNQIKPDQTKERYGDFVTLTPGEHAKLIERLGEKDTVRYIERLNEYIGQIGEKAANKRYKSHYHTILSFYRRDAEKHQKPSNTALPDYTASKGESL